jgi:predicted glycoside hydrolase/deacetylase ChbG (UPF0249 family)
LSARLIVNADDFGFTRDVNAGIVECHRNGILTATTLMANGPAFDDAVRLARENPSLDIGVHLVLVGGPGLPDTVGQLLLAVIRRQIDPYPIMRDQVRKILDAGLEPTHLDTHKHTHLAPPILEAVVRVAQEFGILWVRKPADFTMHPNAAPVLKKLVSAAVRLAAGRFDPVLARAGRKSTDYFTGFQLTGRLKTRELIELIAHLPEGLTELMCHPGYLRDELRAAPTRLKESRELELRALTAPEIRTALVEHRVRLVNYAPKAAP